MNDNRPAEIAEDAMGVTCPTQVFPWLGMSLIVMAVCSCAGAPREGPRGRPGEPSRAEALREAIDETMADARRAVDELGVTEAAMQRIQAALGRLARAPGLKEHGDLRDLHGGGASSAVLASEGKDGLTLILARFQPGKATPVHDHGTWAVAYVLEGQERYTQWERVDDGGDAQRAELRVRYERILGPGDAVSWFDPPHDIHSQQAGETVAWELLVFGKNPLQGTLHYFDVETGRVTAREPLAPAEAADRKD